MASVEESWVQTHLTPNLANLELCARPSSTRDSHLMALGSKASGKQERRTTLGIAPEREPSPFSSFKALLDAQERPSGERDPGSRGISLRLYRSYL